MTRSRRAAVVEIRIPAATQATIVPTPSRQDSRESPSSPEHVAAREDGPSWYCRGAPLGLDLVPGMSGAGRCLKGREARVCPQANRLSRSDWDALHSGQAK